MDIASTRPSSKSCWRCLRVPRRRSRSGLTLGPQAVAEISNIVAWARSGEEDAEAFRLLQHHAMDIGQRRVELMLELAELERES